MTTLGTMLAGKTTRTIGRIHGNGESRQFVLKSNPRIGMVVGCIRDDGRLVNITGRFRDDQTWNDMLGYMRDHVIAEGCALELSVSV